MLAMTITTARSFTLALVVLAAACADNKAAPDAAPDTVTLNKDLLRRYHEDVWEMGRLDHAGLYLGPGFFTHAIVTTVPKGAVIDQNYLGQFWVGFPDLKSHADALLADGDLVVIQWTITGTHTGTFFGIPPTGKSITVSGMDVLRVADGKFVEHWGGIADEMDDFLQQIGAL